MLEIHVIFRGKVQGVGFRAAACGEAQKLGLTGTVRNLPDGTVELIAQGEEKLLKTLLQFLASRFEIEETLERYSPASDIYPDFKSL